MCTTTDYQTSEYFYFYYIELVGAPFLAFQRKLIFFFLGILGILLFGKFTLVCLFSREPEV